MSEKDYQDLSEEALLQLLIAKTNEMHSLMIVRRDTAAIRAVRKEIEKIQKAILEKKTSRSGR